MNGGFSFWLASCLPHGAWFPPLIMKARFLSRLPKVIHIFGTTLAFALPVHAISWDGDNSANWSDPLNWAGETAPDGVTPAEFSATFNGGVATPSSLVILGTEQSAGSLLVSSDVLTFGSASGPSLLNLRPVGGDATTSTLVITGGVLDLASPNGVIPDVSSSLTLADRVTVRIDSGSVGANGGDNTSLIFAGGRLEVASEAILEVGNSEGSGTGRIFFQTGGYGNLIADGATVRIHNGSAFDTNNVNSFASIGTLDLEAGSTGKLGSYFQLWTDHLQIAEGANFTWATDTDYAWSQLWIRDGGFQIDGGASSVGVFGGTPIIDGGKSFKLSNGLLSIGDGQTLAVNGTFSGFSGAGGGNWNPTWFSTLDVGGIALTGSGAIDFSSGSIGLTGQALVIGLDGMFKDADDGSGGPNTAGNLTLGANRGIAVADGGVSVDGSQAGLTTIRAGAKLTIDGGSFFTNTLALESAGNLGDHIDVTGLTRVQVILNDVPVVEFRDSDDQPVYRLYNIVGGYGFQNVGNLTFNQNVALSFAPDGVFDGVNVGGSTDGDGKLDFKSGFFGIGTDLLFTGDSRSTVSQDANYVIGPDQRLLTLGTVRIGPEFSTLRQVGITFDGGSLTAAAVRIGLGGALDVTPGGGMITLQDNHTNDSNWVVGALDASGNGLFQGSSYALADLDSHLGNALNTGGGAAGDAVLGGTLSIDTENLTLLDGSQLTIDGGSLIVRHEVRLGSDGANLDFIGGSLTLIEAPVTIGAGGLLGDSVDLGAGKNLFVNNLTLAADGTLTVDGGYLSSNNFQSDPGAQIDFKSGYIYLGPSVTFGAADEANHPFGDSLVLDETRSLAINGPAFLENGANVTVAGGLFDPSGGLSTAAGASVEWTSGILGSSSNTFTLQNSGTFAIALSNTGETRDLHANIANSGTVTIDGGDGSILNIHGAITNSGVWKVSVPAGQSSTVHYDGTYRLTGSGSYVSDPATHEFSDLVVEDQATLEGVSGDRFVVAGNLTNTSTAAWNVSNAELIFTGGLHQVSGLTDPTQAFGAITLENGAAVTGNITAFNTLNVGPSVGIVGDLTVEGLMNLEIGDLASAMSITGNFTLNGPLNLFFSPDFVFAPNTTFQILNLNGGSFDFTGKTVNFPSDIGTFDFASGTFLVTVPEPSLPMLALVAMGVGLARRRRN